MDLASPETSKSLIRKKTKRSSNDQRQIPRLKFLPAGLACPTTTSWNPDPKTGTAALAKFAPTPFSAKFSPGGRGPRYETAPYRRGVGNDLVHL